MLNESLIDKRIVERNIQKGKVDPAEYRRALDALPDLSSQVWRREEEAPAAAPEKPAEPAQPEQPQSQYGGEAWSDNAPNSEAQPNPFG